MRERRTFRHKVRPDSFFPEQYLAHAKRWSEKMEESANATRLIPAFDVDAQRPEDIYPLHNIIPETEWAALDSLLPKLKNAADDRARVRMLPNARSDWLRQHLMLAYSSSKPKAKIMFVHFVSRCFASQDRI